MSNDEPEIIDAEIVDGDHLPALVEHADTSQRQTPTHHSDSPIEGRDWSTYSRPERRCTAHSSRTGDRCKNVAIKGGKVCRYHGGNAPHVIANARARLQNAADLMARELLGIALTADAESVKLAAIRDALDRAGLKAPSEVVLSQSETKPYEAVFDSIGGDPDAAGFTSAPIAEGGSAGMHASPAPAYDTYADGGKAEAGGGVPGYGDTGQLDDHGPADQERPPPWHHGPPPHGHPARDDRQGQPQPLSEASSQDRPARREAHITGMAAIRMANQANRDSGAWQEQRAIESPHKRYRRP